VILSLTIPLIVLAGGMDGVESGQRAALGEVTGACRDSRGKFAGVRTD